MQSSFEADAARMGEYETRLTGQTFCGILALVTADTGERVRVNGLAVEGWTE